MTTTEWQEQALSLVRAAVLAPSSHNTQPWIFRVGDSQIELFADRTRALPVNDPDDRELSISCGCALMNLRVAAAKRGLGVRVELAPEPSDPDRLARLTIGGAAVDSSAEASLAEQIGRRRTYRKRFATRGVEPTALDRLVEVASVEGAWLRPLQSPESRHQAAALVVEGDAIQWANPSWRRELAAWMHPRRRGDGLTVPALTAPVAQLVVRTFDMGGGVGAKDRELASGSPELAVLGARGDGPLDWLLAGQALQRVLLVACQLGLQASYLNQPVQVPSLRPRLQALVGGGQPQALLRLGHPLEEIPPAPRRPVDAVIEWEPGQG
jgi:nitroreductase